MRSSLKIWACAEQENKVLIAWYAIAIYGTFSIHFHLLAITTYLYQNTRSRIYFLMANVLCAYFLRQNKYSMCLTLKVKVNRV